MYYITRNEYIMDNIYLIVVFIFFVLLCVYGIHHMMLAYARRRKRQAEELFLQSVVDIAIAKRVRVYITPIGAESKCLTEQRGFFIKIHGSVIDIALQKNKNIHHEWEGQYVSIFFNKIEDHGRTKYYTVKGIIECVKKTGLDAEFRFRATSQLMQTQRREFVRFSPPSLLIEEVKLYVANKDELAEHAAPPPVDHPLWLLLPHESYAIKDISASGMCFFIDCAFEACKDIAVGDTMLIILKLSGFKNVNPVSTSLIGVCKNFHDAQDEHCVCPCRSFGIMFRYELVTHHDREMWKKIYPQHGVKPLVNWVIQTQCAFNNCKK